MKSISKKRIIALLFIIIIGTVLFFCYKYGMFKNYGVKEVKERINSFGVFAPIVYIVMFTLVPLTFFPDAILAVAGGMVFGVYLGTIYTVIGAVCGGSLSFFISRVFGRGIVEKLIRHKASWFEDGVEKKGFFIIFILRLVPLIPFDIISYGAGLSKIKFKDFLLATMLGIIPGVFAYVNLGDKSGNLMSIEFVKACAILLLLMAVSYFAKKRLDFDKLQGKQEELR